MALVKFPRADVRQREPMGKASRARHHVGSGCYISGDAGAHLPLLLERTNKQVEKASREKFEELELRKVVPPLSPTRTTIARDHVAP